MKGEAQILKSLNRCLKDQLTAINQLFLHARMAADWGLGEFNEQEYARSIKAMRMADRLIERILFLDGLPNLQDLGKLLIGEHVPEMLQGDLTMLAALRGNLVAAIQLCEAQQDFISRDILSGILDETEQHIDWAETQQWLIEHTGIENYLQSQTGD